MTFFTKNNRRKKAAEKLLCLLLSMGILSGVCGSAFAEEMPVCHIRTEEEFLYYCSQFTLDEWTSGTVFSLDSDLSLSGLPFDPAPIFAGEFRGNGHTISGVSITGAPGEAGIFGIITETGSVTDLNVQGRISPQGEIFAAGGIAAVNRGRISGCSFAGEILADNSAGGITGRNEASGVIENCSFCGKISGLKTAGGIAGENDGEISSCTSSGEINLTVKDRKLRLRDVKEVLRHAGDKLPDVFSVTRLYKSEDIGGIAGFSSGSILSCENKAAVGSQGNGYNLGGIAGSSSGLIYACTNSGRIGGGENVGGICGLASPQVKTDHTKDLLAGPRENFNDINLIINTILLDLDDCVNNLSGDVSSMLGTLQGTMGIINELQYQVTDFVNGKIDEVNQIMDLFNKIFDLGGGVVEHITVIGESVAEGITKLDEASRILTSAKDEPDPAERERLETEANEIMTDARGCLAAGAIGVVVTVREDVEEIRTILSKNALPTIRGIDPEINETLQQLTYSVSGTLGCANALNLQLKATENILNADIRMLTAKLSDIVNDTFDTISSFNFSLSTFLSNSSAEEFAADELSRGLIYGCDNRGTVSGEQKTGGIAGSMALDGIPEIENGSEDAEGFTLKTLDYRLALHSCRNYGSIFTHADYSGAVCGCSSIGAIMNCEAYGLVSSPEGKYVGGIAGFARGEISKCYSKCALSGSSYVGGIVGSGSEKTLLYPQSSVSSCISMAGISSAGQFFGSVAGTSGGSFCENYFVSDTLAGINRYSISGQAEPITYSSFDYLSDVPEEFKTVCVHFIDGTSEIKSVSLPYGGSLNASDLPEISGRLGFRTGWSRDELQNLTEDTAVFVTREFSYLHAAYTLAALSLLVAIVLVFRSLRTKKQHPAGKHST